MCGSLLPLAVGTLCFSDAAQTCLGSVASTPVFWKANGTIHCSAESPHWSFNLFWTYSQMKPPFDFLHVFLLEYYLQKWILNPNSSLVKCPSLVTFHYASLYRSFWIFFPSVFNGLVSHLARCNGTWADPFHKTLRNSSSFLLPILSLAFESNKFIYKYCITIS